MLLHYNKIFFSKSELRFMKILRNNQNICHFSLQSYYRFTKVPSKIVVWKQSQEWFFKSSHKRICARIFFELIVEELLKDRGRIELF